MKALVTILIFLFAQQLMAQDSTLYTVVGEGVHSKHVTEGDTVRFYRDGTLYAKIVLSGDTTYHLAGDSVQYMSITNGGTRKDYTPEANGWKHVFTVEEYTKGIILVGGNRCQAITRKGQQCLRNRKEGYKYCWQHLNYE